LLDATAARLRDAGAPVAESARALKDTAEAAGRALEGLRAIQGQVGDAAGQMATTAATLERSWGAYERRFDQVDQSLERVFERFAEGTQAHHANVQAFVRDLGTALDSAVKTLASGIEQLETTMAEIIDSMDRLRAALTREPALT
jgi:predicted NBD/HSP70 family sugar kinase